MDYADLLPGVHTFQVRAIDLATVPNIDQTPETYTWTVESLDDGLPPDTTILHGPPADDREPDRRLPVHRRARRHLRVLPRRRAVRGVRSSGEEVEVEPGAHVFEVRATDLALNVEQEPARHEWTVIGPPETTIAHWAGRPERHHDRHLHLLGRSARLRLLLPDGRAGAEQHGRVHGLLVAEDLQRPAGRRAHLPGRGARTRSGSSTRRRRSGSGRSRCRRTRSSSTGRRARRPRPSPPSASTPARSTPRSSARSTAPRTSSAKRRTSTRRTSASRCWRSARTPSRSVPPTAKATSTPRRPPTIGRSSRCPTPMPPQTTIDIRPDEPRPWRQARRSPSRRARTAPPSRARSTGPRLRGLRLAARVHRPRHRPPPAPRPGHETPPATSTPRPRPHNWTIGEPPDTTAPETTIDSGPDATTESTSATFTLAASELDSTFECSLDGEPFAACTSPVEFTGLALGAHTLLVQAIDLAGNVDPTPASYTWTIVDETAPETTIGSGPVDPTSSTTASFTFSASEAGSTFECSLDGAPFAMCGLTADYAELAEGPHTLAVRATDESGNPDDGAGRPTSGPSTRSPPRRPSGPGLRTLRAAAVRSFTFAIRAPTRPSSASSTAAPGQPAPSPASYGALANGSHTFAVRATDAAGNVEQTPASRTWTVDTVAPETTIGAEARQHDRQHERVLHVRLGGRCHLRVPARWRRLRCLRFAGRAHRPRGRRTHLRGPVDRHRRERRRDAVVVDLDRRPARRHDDRLRPRRSDRQHERDVQLLGERVRSDLRMRARRGRPSPPARRPPATRTWRPAPTSSRSAPRTRSATSTRRPTCTTWTILAAARDHDRLHVDRASRPRAPSATFTFSSDQADATFECALDGAENFTPCTSPMTYTGARAGPARLHRPGRRDRSATSIRRRRSSAGRSATSRRRSCRSTAARTRSTSSNEATFTFSVDDPDAVLQCSLDGAAFTVCTSPKTYTDLTYEAAYVRGDCGQAPPAGRGHPGPARVDDRRPRRTGYDDHQRVDGRPPDATFEFTGSDNATFAIDLDFECSLDGARRVVLVAQGVHRPHRRRAHLPGPRDRRGPERRSDTCLVHVDRRAAPNTEVGENITVLTTTSEGEATLTFAEVTAAGETSITEIIDTPPLPEGTIQLGALFYDIDTTAGFTGPVTICLPYDVAAFADPSAVRLFHYEAGTPVDVTTLNDTDAGLICGVVTEPVAIRDRRARHRRPRHDHRRAAPRGSPAATRPRSPSPAEEGATFSCSLDAAAAAPCTSPAGYTGLADGTHTFAVAATDAAGNTGAAGRPHLDGRHDRARDDDHERCPRAARSPTTAPASCSAPTTPAPPSRAASTAPPSRPARARSTLAGLADGSHTFSVRATDAAGNTDASPATASWTVDTTAPSTTIEGGPEPSTSDTGATFAFASEDGATFSCRLDGADAEPCTSPAGYTGLALGAHTFAVSATDAAGQRPARRPRTPGRSWSRPTPTPPTRPSTAAPRGSPTQRRGRIAFCLDEDGATFSCSLDAAAAAPCTSPAGLHRPGRRDAHLRGRRHRRGRQHRCRGRPHLDGRHDRARDDDHERCPRGHGRPRRRQPRARRRRPRCHPRVQPRRRRLRGLRERGHARRPRRRQPHLQRPRHRRGGQHRRQPRDGVLDGRHDRAEHDHRGRARAVHERHGRDVRVRLRGRRHLQLPPRRRRRRAVHEPRRVHRPGPRRAHLRGQRHRCPGQRRRAGHVRLDDRGAARHRRPRHDHRQRPRGSHPQRRGHRLLLDRGGRHLQLQPRRGRRRACTSPAGYTGLADGDAHLRGRRHRRGRQHRCRGRPHLDGRHDRARDDDHERCPRGHGRPRRRQPRARRRRPRRHPRVQPRRRRLRGLREPRSRSPAWPTAATPSASAPPTRRATPTPAPRRRPGRSTRPGRARPSRAGPSRPRATRARRSRSPPRTAPPSSCRLDGADAEPCTSPAGYTDLALGAHTFAVSATDALGNDGAPATYAWTIVEPPDTDAPDTTIDSGPAGLDPQRRGRGSPSPRPRRAPPSSCSLDAAAAAPCTSPAGYTGLGRRRRTPSRSPPPTRPATPVPPPASPGRSTRPRPRRRSRAVPPRARSPTTAPASSRRRRPRRHLRVQPRRRRLRGLREPGHARRPRRRQPHLQRPRHRRGGQHRRQPRDGVLDGRHDRARARPSRAGPSRPRATRARRSRSPPRDGATFSCRLDGADAEPCTSPAGYTDLALGAHTFAVSATDALGNDRRAGHVRLDDRGAARHRRPRHDHRQRPRGPHRSDARRRSPSPRPRTAPPSAAASTRPPPRPARARPAYDGLADGDAHLRGRRHRRGRQHRRPGRPHLDGRHDRTRDDDHERPGEPDLADLSRLHLLGADDDGATFECSLDGGAFGPCASPADSPRLADGRHTFAVRATDAAGNTDATPGDRYLDGRHDRARARRSRRPRELRPRDSDATFTFSAASLARRFECGLDDDALRPCTSPAELHRPRRRRAHVPRPRDRRGGQHRPSPAIAAWTVDTTAPEPRPSTSGPADLTSADLPRSFTFRRDEPAPPSSASFAAATTSTRARARRVHRTWPTASTRSASAPPTRRATPAPPPATPGRSTRSRPSLDDRQPARPGPSSRPTATLRLQRREPAPPSSASSARATTSTRARARRRTPASPTASTRSASAPPTRPGNRGAAAARTWTVDTTAPATTIDSGPAGTVSQRRTPRFDVLLRGGRQLRVQARRRRDFDVLHEPARATPDLADGEHTFRVRATDAAGNSGPAAEPHVDDRHDRARGAHLRRPATVSVSATARDVRVRRRPGRHLRVQARRRRRWEPVRDRARARTRYNGLADGPAHVPRPRHRRARQHGPVAERTWTVDTTRAHDDDRRRSPTSTPRPGAPSSPSTRTSRSTATSAGSAATTSSRSRRARARMPTPTSPTAPTSSASARSTGLATRGARCLRVDRRQRGAHDDDHGRPERQHRRQQRDVQLRRRRARRRFECRRDEQADWHACTSPREYHGPRRR